MRALKRSAWGAAAAALIGGFGLAASPAAADELLGATPEVEGSHAAACAARLSDDPASWQAELTAPASGFLRGSPPARAPPPMRSPAATHSRVSG